MRDLFKILAVVIKICIGLYSGYCYSLSFNISKNSDIVGTKQSVILKKDDNLSTIARKFNITITELMLANPKVNPKNIKAGIKLVVPTEFILPSGPRIGIVLNLAEFRLYYFPENQKIVYTFPVGIGRLGWKTPLGETTIVHKRDHPTWVPPPSIREHYENKGKILPDSIPPGPDNPLGEYAINLAWSNYLIHGTNAPNSIGLRSSSGCVRMYPEDIERLFNLVNIGTLVRVIHEPFKIGKKNQDLYIEVHEAFKEKYYNDEELTETELLNKIIDEHYKRFKNHINWGYIDQNLKQSTGYPIVITK